MTKAVVSVCLRVVGPPLWIGNESVPIQLAQCWFHGLTISNAKISIYFSNKIYRCNFIKQYSETVMVWNYRNADRRLKNKFIVSFIIIFGTLSFPIRPRPGPVSGPRKVLSLEQQSVLLRIISNTIYCSFRAGCFCAVHDVQSLLHCKWAALASTDNSFYVKLNVTPALER